MPANNAATTTRADFLGTRVGAVRLFSCAGLPAETLAPGRSAFDWSGFRADLRAAVPDATAALIATVLIFVWLYAQVRSGTSPTVEVMPFLADANRYWMYWLCQAFVEVFVPGGYPSGTGVVAILIGLLALYLAITLGLLFYFGSGGSPRG